MTRAKTKVVYVDRPSIAEVRQAIWVFNKLFFGGVLPEKMAIRFCRMNWLGDYEAPGERYPYGLMRLSTTMSCEGGWLAVALHECIHAYLALLHPTLDEWDWHDHGQEFCDVCNRISRTMNWPEISVDTAWHYPMCLELDYLPDYPEE